MYVIQNYRTVCGGPLKVALIYEARRSFGAEQMVK